jgi:hypothetical protein
MKNKLSNKSVVSILAIILLGSFLSVPIASARAGVPVPFIENDTNAQTPRPTSLSLSRTSITVGIGQALSVMSENGIGVYLGLNSSPTIAAALVNGTQVTITGQTIGTDTVSICAVGTASDCTNLSVTVQAENAAGVLFSQSNLSLSTNSSQSVTVSGGNGTYMVWSNSNTSAASTSLSSSTLTVYGLAVGGDATITVCDTSNTNTCGTVSVTVKSSSMPDVSPAYVQTASSSYIFSQNLTVGSTGSDVIALQQILINKGYLTSVSAPTGYFGNCTQSALEKFQTANGISPVSGYFGPKTRTFLNSGNTY